MAFKQVKSIGKPGLISAPISKDGYVSFSISEPREGVPRSTNLIEDWIVNHPAYSHDLIFNIFEELFVVQYRWKLNNTTGASTMRGDVTGQAQTYPSGSTLNKTFYGSGTIPTVDGESDKTIYGVQNLASVFGSLERAFSMVATIQAGGFPSNYLNVVTFFGKLK